MTHKKWLFIIVVISLLSLGGFGFLNYMLDPMLQYGTERGILTSYEYAEMYSNPGIAKNYKYDSIMVGTSMIENTDVDLCDQLWNVDMVRLPYSGGTSFNMKTILDVAFNHNPDIRNVYWELDEFQLFGVSDQPRYPLPTYLYDDNKFNDLKYLLNLDIFYHYTLKNVINSLRGQNLDLERRGITLTGDFSKAAVMASYSRKEQRDEVIDFQQSSMKSKVDKNLDNICPLIEKNPTIKFSFFMPPFSVLYWDQELRNGSFEGTMDGVEYALEKLLSYENVRIYFYHDAEDIIQDLDNYKDFSHYGNWVNDQVTQWMAEEKGIITEDNYKSVIGNFKEFIYNYDYEKIFSEAE